MDKDKETDFDDTFGAEEDDFGSDTASRARNRTVMLTPEITGEVRARLAKDMGSKSIGDFLSPAGTPPPIVAPEVPHAPSKPAAPVQAPITSSFQPASRPVAPQRSPEEVYSLWDAPSPVIGFLVCYEPDVNGVFVELRTGRLIVTSEPPSSGNSLIIQDESVSPMHAIMRISASGEIQVLDQLSEFGTKILHAGSKNEEELSGEKSSLSHGDIIAFGEKRFHVCLVSRGGVGK